MYRRGRIVTRGGKGEFPTKLFPLRSIRQVLTQLNLEDTKI